MSAAQSLAEKWGIAFSSESLAQCTDSNNETHLRQFLLSSDIRKLDLSSPLIPPNLQRISTDQKQTIQGTVFVQVIKVTDLTKPLRKTEDGEELIQEGPKGLLSLHLTDGTNKFELIDLNNTPTLTTKKTAPGTKLLLKETFRIVNGIVFSTERSKVELLGGVVDKLFEAWEANNAVRDKRALQLGPTPVKTDIADGGPPKFVSFVAAQKSGVQAKSSGNARRGEQQPDPPAPVVAAPRVTDVQSSQEKNFNKKLAADAFQSSHKPERRPRRGDRFAARDIEEQYSAKNASSAGLDLGSFINVNQSANKEAAGFLKELQGVKFEEPVAGYRQEDLPAGGTGGLRGGRGGRGAGDRGRGGRRGEGTSGARGGRATRGDQAVPEGTRTGSARGNGRGGRGGRGGKP